MLMMHAPRGTGEWDIEGWSQDQVNSPQRANEIAARASAALGREGVPLNMAIEVREVYNEPSM